MASPKILQCIVALTCFLLSLHTAPATANPIPDFFMENPSSNNPSAPPPTTQPSVNREESTSFDQFLDYHDDSDNNGNSQTQRVGGFHLKLAAEVQVDQEAAVNLEKFSLSEGDNGELYIATHSGFDNIHGIFRPSNGFYLLSCLVHVAVKPQDEGAAVRTTSEPTAVGQMEDSSRVTLTFCINGNCGSSAVLKSTSVLPSSGELHTLSLSGVLQLRNGQQVTLKLENHSKERQVIVSDRSTLLAYQLEALE